MTTSQEFDKVVQAIHEVQQEIEVIAREDKADVGSYSYKYAGLPKIWEQLKPLLKKNELTIVQSPTSGETGVISDQLQTTIYHSSGQWIKEQMRLIMRNEDPQGMGAAITYARRYMISAMFGLITDEDNDAAGQKLATGEQKKDWVRAFTIVSKKANPDSTPTYNEFVKFIEDVYGKHPTRILAKEHQTVLDTINAFDN